jgi:hypothetical protein
MEELYYYQGRPLWFIEYFLRCVLSEALEGKDLLQVLDYAVPTGIALIEEHASGIL